MTSFDDSAILNSTPNSKHLTEPTSPQETFHSPAPVLAVSNANNDVNDVEISSIENNSTPEKNDSDSVVNSSKDKDEFKEKVKAEKKAAKKLLKELTICKIILEEMEVIHMILNSVLYFKN